MSKQKFYQSVIYPFTVVAMAAAFGFLLYGVKNLMGSSDLPAPSAVPGGERPAIKLISPVEKRVELKGDITLNPGKNPFTSDHKDWVVADKDEQDNASEKVDLNLEVRGIVTIKSRTKAMVVDLDEKNGKSFWLRPGDFYKGYTVAYISRHNIVFVGKGKNIRFALKRGKGKLYSGKGEIFVAPDIDLYLDRLQAEDGGEVIAAKDKGETGAEDAASPPEAEAGHASGGQAGRLSSGPSSPSGSSGPTSTGTRAASDTRADQGGRDSPPGTTQEEEMAFIKELMKIFEKRNKK